MVESALFSIPEVLSLPLRQYEQVRLGQLLQSPDAYNGWRVNHRPPAVGDVGIIVDILKVPGMPDSYVVESTGTDGGTIWLGDFRAEELVPLTE